MHYLNHKKILHKIKKIAKPGHVTQAVATLLCTVAVLAGSGCESVSQSAPVKGGSYVIAAPTADFREVLAQGDNAHSPSRLMRTLNRFDNSGNLISQMQTRIDLGTSRDPIITLRPIPPYGQYAVAAIGAIALIGGAVLAFKAWPKIGATLSLGGFTTMIIALTAGQYGWLWALLAAGVCVAAVAALYSGYRSGINTEKSLPATPAAA